MSFVYFLLYFVVASFLVIASLFVVASLLLVIPSYVGDLCLSWLCDNYSCTCIICPAIVLTIYLDMVCMH